MEDNPLKAKKRAQTSPETELSTEMQLMEDKFIIYDFTKVKRSHSLNRGKIMRTATSGTINTTGAGGYHDLHKINSTSTLDCTLVATRNSTGRIEQLPMMGAPPPKIPRPESPSDRVGQDRFNPDEDNLSLISTDLSHRSGSKNEVTQTQAQNPRVSIYRLQEKAEVAEDEAVVMLSATTAIPVAPRPFSHERGTALFSAPDSGASPSSITPSGTPLMDSVSVFNHASRPRPRGREGQFNSSSPSPLGHVNYGTVYTTRSSQSYSTPAIAQSGRSFETLASTQQQQHGASARPMSAYTTSHTAHDEGFQETKSLTMAYIPTLLSNGFPTSLGIGGLEGFNETPANVAEDAYTKHNNVYKTRGAKDQELKGEKTALADEALMQTVLV